MERRALAISRDGQRLVFSTEESEGDGTKLLTVPTSGGEVEELFRLEKTAGVRSAEWTADGKYVLLSTREERGSGLWRISVESGDAQKLLWNPKSRISGFSLHPRGGQIALSLFSHETEIWVMEDYLASNR